MFPEDEKGTRRGTQDIVRDLYYQANPRACAAQKHVYPLSNWSHSDCLRCTLTIEGWHASSAATSPQARWRHSLNAVAEGTLFSQEQKKPKKQVVAAARSMANACSCSAPEGADHTESRPRKMSMVIRRQFRCWVSGCPLVRRDQVTPACTSFRRGSELAWGGSGKPLIIWACLIPAR